MSGTAKLLTVLILLLSAAFATVSATLYAVRVDWKTKAEEAKREKIAIEETLTAEVDRLKRLNGELEEAKTREITKVNALTREVATTKSTVGRMEKQVDQLTTYLSTEKTLSQQLRAQLKEADAEKKRLDVELAKANTTLDAERKVAKARQQEIEVGKSKINDLTTELTSTQKTLTDTAAEAKRQEDILTRLAENNVDLGTAARQPVKGQVVKSDGSLVVINRGKQHGVKIGSQFTIYSADGHFVGKMTIKGTQNDMAYGTPVRGFIKRTVQAGDYVTNTIQ